MGYNGRDGGARQPLGICEMVRGARSAGCDGLLLLGPPSGGEVTSSRIQIQPLGGTGRDRATDQFDRRLPFTLGEYRCAPDERKRIEFAEATEETPSSPKAHSIGITFSPACRRPAGRRESSGQRAASRWEGGRGRIVVGWLGPRGVCLTAVPIRTNPNQSQP